MVLLRVGLLCELQSGVVLRFIDLGYAVSPWFSGEVWWMGVHRSLGGESRNRWAV